MTKIIFQPSGGYHIYKPSGERDYDAELLYAESLARSAARLHNSLAALKARPETVLADPRGIQSIARAVIATEMDIYEAEHRIFLIAAAASHPTPETCIEQLHIAIQRYGAETTRIAQKIRDAVKPMMRQRASPDTIKTRASEINKQNFLTQGEIKSILRSEYTEWKSTQSPINLPKTTSTGKPTTPAPLRPHGSQSSTLARA